MEIIEKIFLLRKRIVEFRNSDKYIKFYSTYFYDLCVLELVCCYSELGISKNRPISVDEEFWFNGARFIDETFEQGNSGDWSDIARMYTDIVKYVRENNYFRT